MRRIAVAWGLVGLVGLVACGAPSVRPTHPASRVGVPSAAIEERTDKSPEGVTVATSGTAGGDATVPDSLSHPACEKGAWDGVACVWAVCARGMTFRIGAGCVQKDGMRCVLSECGDSSFHAAERTGASTRTTVGAPFDAERTKDALRSVDLGSCEGESGSRGWAELGVVVEPEGHVTEVTPPRSLAGTEKAKCVSALLFARSLGPFQGYPRRLHVDVFVP
jgi:hypothetical protein